MLYPILLYSYITKDNFLSFCYQSRGNGCVQQKKQLS